MEYLCKKTNVKTTVPGFTPKARSKAHTTPSATACRHERVVTAGNKHGTWNNCEDCGHRLEYVRKAFLREDPTLVCAAKEHSEEEDEKEDDNTDVTTIVNDPFIETIPQ